MLEDPQQGELVLPRGVKRYRELPREERVSTLRLSWWFTGQHLATLEGMQRFVALLLEYLPEALPRRYGLWEPPQHKTEETGVEALVQFMLENLGKSAVYYPTRPVVGFHLAYSGMAPDLRGRFRCNMLSIDVELAALHQPGMENALRRLWRKLSSFLSPFYGEARHLHGHVWGACLGSDSSTDQHPVRSWFWRGIPRQLGVALVLGPRYLEHWRPKNALLENGLSYNEVECWSDTQSLGIEVPEKIALESSDERGETLPLIWPFG
ncbi:hypothetical protein G6O69_02735 [Pseudenhygromyxa sp. WMMC2535]|uniref:hypothetical protein n=1 Tax=Pseudenhygromyxa sp. WMMC2535 TaxID=2712867 RepID=UPI001555B23F|nr:hypothetical protein [Pseudenhygromyxa sp. WMMC2535]NVB36732.1 hypothetical protein [Pseudenhygromyxa sp. WMMC2535]